MSYTEEEARRLVVDAGIRLVKEGLTARTWGNISARISDSEFIITPSGMAYESLGPGDLVRCRIEDCSYEGEIKPSSEKWTMPTHTGSGVMWISLSTLTSPVPLR